MKLLEQTYYSTIACSKKSLALQLQKISDALQTSYGQGVRETGRALM